MKKQNMKSIKVRGTNLVSTVVVIMVIVFLADMWGKRLDSKHHEPYINPESYEELKGRFDENAQFVFPDELLKRRHSI